MIEHSVLIYCQNHGRFVGECVESVLRQTVQPEEIVVYDGGSTDDSLAVLRRFGTKIRLIAGARRDEAPHITQARAVHQAFAASQGEVLFLLDGDDRFKPDKIERYAAAFHQHPDASVVQAPLERIDSQGAIIGAALEPRYHITNHLHEIYRQQDLNFFYPTSALAFTRAFLERVLPLDLSDERPLWTDARLCIPAVYYGRIVTLYDPLTDWRIHTSADARRAGRGNLQIRQTFWRAEVFNDFCRTHNLRTISPWRSLRLYRRLLRWLLPFDLGAASPRRPCR